MATRSISLMNRSVLNLSGDVHAGSSLELFASTTQFFRGWIFNDGADAGIAGVFFMPAEYVDTPLIEPYWTAATSAKVMRWNFRHRLITAGTQRVDISTSPTEVVETSQNTASLPGASGDLEVESVALTAGDFTAGQYHYYEWTREGANAADTLAVKMLLLDLRLKFNDA